jgi:hypothetical protein
MLLKKLKFFDPGTGLSDPKLLGLELFAILMALVSLVFLLVAATKPDPRY